MICYQFEPTFCGRMQRTRVANFVIRALLPDSQYAAASNDFNDVKIDSNDNANNEDGIILGPARDMFLRWCNFNGSRRLPYGVA